MNNLKPQASPPAPLEQRLPVEIHASTAMRLHISYLAEKRVDVRINQPKPAHSHRACGIVEHPLNEF